MSIADADDLESAVRHALMTTRATAVCPFHPEVTVRVGDDAAETHALNRARNLVKATALAGIMICWWRNSRANSTTQPTACVPMLVRAFCLMVWQWQTSSSDVPRAGNLYNTGWTKNSAVPRIPIVREMSPAERSTS
jgi:hypothetical protein